MQTEDGIETKSRHTHVTREFFASKKAHVISAIVTNKKHQYAGGVRNAEDRVMCTSILLNQQCSLITKMHFQVVDVKHSGFQGATVTVNPQGLFLVLTSTPLRSFVVMRPRTGSP